MRIAGLTSRDGRATILMPHPERTLRSGELQLGTARVGWARRFAVAADVPQRARLGGLKKPPGVANIFDRTKRPGPVRGQA